MMNMGPLCLFVTTIPTHVTDCGDGGAGGGVCVTAFVGIIPTGVSDKYYQYTVSGNTFKRHCGQRYFINDILNSVPHIYFETLTFKPAASTSLCGGPL